MVDFKKRLSTKQVVKKTNPIELYESLDRSSDKGPLRPAQESILHQWHESRRNDKDVIVKLHTGQGKTLIGLLMLQSKLNEGKGPVLYVCPNIFLVEQTCEQAKQFGFAFCTVDQNNQIPIEFYDSKAILITHVQLLFNGMTKFGLGRQSDSVHAVVLDDSHACIDVINEAFTIKITAKEDGPYAQILNLFEEDLEHQGISKIEEIRNKEYETFLPVPYWAWQEKNKELVKILVQNKGINSIKFAWNIIQDDIVNCMCVISGSTIEITPYRRQLDLFRSFDQAQNRIFMSATTNNDSFLIKGLGVSSHVIKKPLLYEKEKWSGEKLILIPYLIDTELTRTEIVNAFAVPNEKRKYGIVAITPSFKNASLWEKYGAVVVNADNIDKQTKKLKEGNFSKTIVFANRYDGVDLPDDSCRVLILDLKPFGNSLIDLYLEHCRPDSTLIDLKLAQKIEQGLGRGVRGEKDYCVIVISSPDLINRVRNNRLKKHFSSQTNRQIDIGLEVAKMAVEEMATSDGWSILRGLINQVISRDEGWKSFYVESMNEIDIEKDDKLLLETLELEKTAEDYFFLQNYRESVKALQKLIDTCIPVSNSDERGWYIQEMARYTYAISKQEANKLQVAAHKANRALLRPQTGMEFEKLAINNTRIENIKTWARQFETYEELNIRLIEMLTSLAFGVKSEKFESSLFHLGKALGFGSERPDHEWKAGPDNLWNIRRGHYILFECKNEVDERREEIVKAEAAQMNVSCGWFKNHYKGELVKNILIIPTRNVSKASAFTQDVEIMRKRELNKLKNNIRGFFRELKSSDLDNLSNQEINEALSTHNLTEENIISDYSVLPYQK